MFWDDIWNMVIVQLTGGLGNQLFQYATARAIAYRNSVSLGLDISQFVHFPERVYKLDHFHIEGVVVSELKVNYLTRNRLQGIHRRLAALLHFLFPNIRHAILEEKHYHFDPEILYVPGNVYLAGYWQSEKYFKDVEGILRRELTVKGSPDKENAEMLDRIGRTEAVSLHIRRGDYVSDPNTRKQHGICSLEYYERAVYELAGRIGTSLHFFVFSDDIAWARENLELGYPVTYVDHNGVERDYEDLRLMRRCNHHIIANSSFSWWGAWLCSNPQKVVIAPQKWFNEVDKDTRDLIPPAWLRI